MSPLFSLYVLRAVRHSHFSDTQRPKWQFTLSPSPDDFAKYMESCEAFAFDCETPRSDHTNILLGGFSGSHNTAMTVLWVEPYISIAKRHLEDHKKTKIIHNADFDLTALEAYNILCRPVDDTIIMANVLEPDYSPALHSVCSMYFNWYVYWKELGDDAVQQQLWAKVLELPSHFSQWDMLYNALDAAHTYKLWYALQGSLRGKGQVVVYNTQMRVLNVIRRMEQRGLRVNPVTHHKLLKEKIALKTELTERVNIIVKEHYAEQLANWERQLDVCVKKRVYWVAEKKRRKKEMPDCIECFNKADAQHKDVSKRVTWIRNKIKRVGKGFNPDSDNDWRWLLYNHLGLPVMSVTKTGLPGVSKEALQTLRTRARKLTEEQSRMLDTLEELSSISDEIGTFLFAKQDKSGRYVVRSDRLDNDYVAHPGYQLYKTATGRLASGSKTVDIDKPADRLAYNAQNIPKALRKMYVPHDARNVFLEVDWSQIELRIMAWELGVESLTRALRDGLDVHRENAATRPGCDRIPSDIGDDERTLAKRFTHGVNYGMGARKASWVFKISESEARQWIRAYFKRWPGLEQGRKRLIAKAIKDRKITTRFGWSRRVLSKDPEVILAFVPQSTAASMLKVTLPLVAKYVEGNGYGELRTTTHDSILMEVPDDKQILDTCVRGVKEIMQTPFPELDGFWCPADFKLGRRWGELVDYPATMSA